MTQTPAGWYDDGSGRLRYWDGAAWTAHFADTYVAPAASPPQTFQPAQPSSSDCNGPEASATLGAEPARGAYAPTAGDDPFAVRPGSTAYARSGAPDAKGPRKRLPGWGIALIVVGTLLIVGIFALAVFAALRFADAVDDPAGDFGDIGSTAAIYTVYWELGDAYRDDSCAALNEIATQNYFESIAIDSTTCEGASVVDEDETGFYGEVADVLVDGDIAALSATESYYFDSSEYTSS